jgi:hypothetical protein
MPLVIVGTGIKNFTSKPFDLKICHRAYHLEILSRSEHDAVVAGYDFFLAFT